MKRWHSYNNVFSPDFFVEFFDINQFLKTGILFIIGNVIITINLRIIFSNH